MIVFFHRDDFTLPQGKEIPYFKIKKLANNKIVVPHPLLPFDHLSNDKIYRQTFELDWTHISLATDFLEKSIKHADLRTDENLWYDTGYWTIEKDGCNYLGLGFKTLPKSLTELKNGKLACCLANRDSIIIIWSKFENNCLKETLLDIYVTNTYLPYVEVIQPFRNALEEMRNYQATKENFIDERLLHKNFVKNKVYLDKPLALIKTKRDNVPIIAILQNPFRSIADANLSSLEYLLGQMAGGFLESDFLGKVSFSAIMETWYLRDVIVASLLYK